MHTEALAFRVPQG